MMYIKEYRVLTGDLGIDRSKYMTGEFGKLIKEFAESITGTVALLYAGGPAIHHSDSRNFDGINKEEIVIKTQIGLNMMNVAKLFKNANIEYASINANTCASSMYCFYEAQELMKAGIDKVVIVAMEMSEPSQLKLFEQLGINIKCGDGVSIIVLDRYSGIACIDKVVWKWNNDKSPMSVSKDGYLKVLKELDLDNIDVVKPHGTGTDRNDEAENEALIEVGLGDVEKKMYKKKVGHTQGASTSVEVGMLLDEVTSGTKGVVLASGMGGFYGGFTIWKME